MNPKCLSEIEAVTGRRISAEEATKIENDLKWMQRRLRDQDPNAWRAMSTAERLAAAADALQLDVIQSADRAANRKAGRIVAQAREAEKLTTRAAQFKARGIKNGHHQAMGELALQLEAETNATRNASIKELGDVVEAVSPEFFGLIASKDKAREFVRAVLDGKAEDPVMTKAAKAWTELSESLRVRQNALGADIGRLDYSYLPQSHDVLRMRKGGSDAWAEQVLPLLRRDKYIRADGSNMTDDEIRGMLRDAWETITTDGLYKGVPGGQGQGSRAARFDDAHRSIHFKDADSYMQYMDSYGKGSVLEAVQAHVMMAAKNIALMERMGPNPSATWDYLSSLAERGDGGKKRVASVQLKDIWANVNGSLTPDAAGERMARFSQAVRNVEVAAKLGSAVLSSATDPGLMFLVARNNGMPTGAALKSIFEGFGSKGKALADDLGISIDEITSGLARFAEDRSADGLTGRLSNSIMKASYLNGFTESLKRGFSLGYLRQVDKLRKSDWTQLSEWDRRRMESSGVDEATWKIWQAAGETEGMLTQRGISMAPGFTDAQKSAAITRLMAHLDMETNLAVMAPDVLTRTALNRGSKAGTYEGELFRFVSQFKSFPVSMMMKHARRIRDIPDTKSKIGYSVALVGISTTLGALSMTLKDLAKGQDPRDMTTGKFWTAAFVQGGGLGIVGDLFYTGLGGNNRFGQANWTTFAGPVASDAAALVDLTLGNIGEAARGEKVDFGAEAVRFAKGVTPGLSLWYLRGAIDHMVLHDLQEQLSPGYLRRMRQRAQKDWGQEYFWEPGEAVPDRAPDFAAAVGE